MAPVTSFAVIGTAPGVATLEQVTTPVIQADQILVKVGLWGQSVSTKLTFYSNPRPTPLL